MCGYSDVTHSVNAGKSFLYKKDVNFTLLTTLIR